MKPIHKFNNGNGATLCHKCSTIISVGFTDDLYCKECRKEMLQDMMKEDEALGLYSEQMEKEEPKQETLEEASEKYENSFYQPNGTESLDFIAGAKWQAERMYSEEKVYKLLCSMPNFFNMTIPQQIKARDKWFEQFKNK